jgi:formylglycine-generating enzyme required for sulfatase activity
MKIFCNARRGGAGVRNFCLVVFALAAGALAFAGDAPASIKAEDGSVWTVPEDFVLVEGGTFTMGSPEGEPGRGKDEAQHEVTLTSFYMAKYEVSQGEYEAVMGSNPSRFKTRGNLPVETVSWYDAIDYCIARSKKEGLSPAYTRKGDRITWHRGANGYRLPTEAEWEYACRAGTPGPFYTGGGTRSVFANYNGNDFYNGASRGVFRRRTTFAGRFPPNAWGLFDMHGNVWEWCWDIYSEYDADDEYDPAGIAAGPYRVLRGGSWNSSAGDIRSARRGASDPHVRRDSAGFRLALPFPEEAEEAE